ncbi:hypothetical protein HER32_09520 [Hymenobacter sp. BT18]|uniref:hypothetical protein n=1 Tax=Hymenobacter sp. BT18 TaxID=2835648 RepID=UPI00143E9F24|nr:hypothetical protein [Hymenobacter sp. BT18]QIX61403.1 hypothetical protein HER32_09520 [Hymenobacter sp. BT18]
MSRKSLPELFLYVHKRQEYREDAVLAALDELARRGEEPAEAAAIRTELLPIVAQQHEEKRQAAARTTAEPAVPTPYAPADAEGPALYSPGTIVLFSMLFSFFVGGILFVINMFRLKESGKAVRLILFLVAVLAGQYFGLRWLTGMYGPEMQLFSTVGVNFVAVLVYLLYFWPRYVGARPYVSRQWLPALLICLVVIYGLVKLAAPYMVDMAK